MVKVGTAAVAFLGGVGVVPATDRLRFLGAFDHGVIPSTTQPLDQIMVVGEGDFDGVAGLRRRRCSRSDPGESSMCLGIKITRFCSRCNDEHGSVINFDFGGVSYFSGGGSRWFAAAAKSV